MTSEEFVDEVHLVLFGHKFEQYLTEWDDKDSNESLKNTIKHIRRMDELSFAWSEEGFSLEEHEVTRKVQYLGLLDHGYNKLKDMLKPRKEKCND